jgi:hypothetical protein
MTVEHWLKDNDKQKQKFLERNFSPYLFASQHIHLHCLWIEHGPPRQEAGD